MGCGAPPNAAPLRQPLAVARSRSGRAGKLADAACERLGQGADPRQRAPGSWAAAHRLTTRAGALALAGSGAAAHCPHAPLGLLKDGVRRVMEQPDAADGLARAQALQVAQERDRVQAQQQLRQRAQRAQVGHHLRSAAPP